MKEEKKLSQIPFLLFSIYFAVKSSKSNQSSIRRRRKKAEPISHRSTAPTYRALTSAMGNCLFGAANEPDEPTVQVSTATGAIMEFPAPITAGCIVKEFPGHFIFKSHDLFWKPLPHQAELHAGESYCLLKWAQRHAGHVRSKSIPAPAGDAAPKPYRMSFDSRGVLKRSASTEVSRFVSSSGQNGGVWKVKLVISPEQLVEILSQEGPTEELIENVRSVAKCGASRAASMDFSDQLSVSSRSVSSSN